jgi:hypothetical protein
MYGPGTLIHTVFPMEGPAASKIVGDQSLCLCRSDEHFVIADDGVVEIYADPESHLIWV